MASYNLVFRPSVQKDLQSLPTKMVARVLERVEKLREEPFPRGSLKLAGAENLYRLRIGDYRVIYGVDHSAQCVLVHYVRHRRDAYR